ncbi:MAG TPA: hypothetical protein VMV06_05215 [Acidimicrobiales bacterium]|nr:hypothetical protein [Acidimicrobiales bacterium]
MSDVSRGEGWWLASDLKWYPPESAGDVAPPAVPSTPESVPERGPAPPGSGTGAPPSDPPPSGPPPSGPPPSGPPQGTGGGNGQNSLRSRRLLVGGLALTLALAGGGAALALRSSGRPLPHGTADLPFSGETARGPVDTNSASSSNGTARSPHITTATHRNAAAASHPCCRVPEVVGEQFVNAESDVYSAQLTPTETYGTAADCAGIPVPPRSFVIGREAPVQGSVLAAGTVVVLYFCDGANRA